MADDPVRLALEAMREAYGNGRLHRMADVALAALPDPDVAESEHPEATCQDCGRPNPVWFAPNDLWNTVRPEGGIICPSCFAAQAEVRGYGPTGWSFAPESELTGDGLRAGIEALRGLSDKATAGRWVGHPMPQAEVDGFRLGLTDTEFAVACVNFIRAILAALPNREAAPVTGDGLRALAARETAEAAPITDDCPTCGGRGWTVDADPLPNGEPNVDEPYQVQCYDCAGSGHVVIGETWPQARVIAELRAEITRRPDPVPLLALLDLFALPNREAAPKAESEPTTGDPARDFVYWFVQQPHHRQQAFVIDWLARHPEVVRDTRWPFAALPNREAAPREATVDHFATQLQETGRATVFDGGEAHAVLAALRAIGIQSFTVVVREAAQESRSIQRRKAIQAAAKHSDARERLAALLRLPRIRGEVAAGAGGHAVDAICEADLDIAERLSDREAPYNCGGVQSGDPLPHDRCNCAPREEESVDA